MLEDIINVPRTDAVYNMHGYLTKVPVRAIIPFIEEYTEKGGTVVDMFAGSGMTAIASAMSGRNAIVSDISVLGQHIGTGYLEKVSIDALRTVVTEIVSASKQTVGKLYLTKRASDGETVEAIRTVWSFVYRCESCKGDIVYYDAFKEAKWISSKIKCGSCGESFAKKGARVVGEAPVLTVVKEHRQVEQPLGSVDFANLKKAEKLDYQSKIPSLPITEDREMFKRSALKKWGMTDTRLFFSQRNSAVLFDLWERINSVKDKAIRQKLRFCFTAILPRASKRYQWSPKAPLNAANQNYYIAPVFYEWNVYDLFLRKIEAVERSDNLVFGSNGYGNQEQNYVLASADALDHIKNESIDLVFTDPPFGSNIFYSDMNLFQEAWIGQATDFQSEAVIRTTVSKEEKLKSKNNYKDILKRSFQEAYRILRPGGHLCVVFGNSKGDVWSLAQEAFTEAGFNEKPVAVNILDKGQRSVKGLNSGSENVATLDLIVTLKKPAKKTKAIKFGENLDSIIEQTFSELRDWSNLTASHVYLEVLKNALYQHINIAKVDLQHILDMLKEHGYTPAPDTGRLVKSNPVTSIAN